MFYIKCVTGVVNLNENKEKIDNIKASTPKKAGNVSNPLSKQLNSLKKPALKQPVETVKKQEKKASNPISAETSSIVARINNFNTNKTSNRMYAGYMNGNGSNAHKVIDYADLVQCLNSVLCTKTSVHELFVSVNDLFTDKLGSLFTAFGVIHEKTKCIN